MTRKVKTKRATESQFDELHSILTTEFLARIKSGEATTADLKAAADWLAKNDITGIGYDDSPLGKLADLMPKVDFDAVQKAVHRKWLLKDSRYAGLKKAPETTVRTLCHVRKRMRLKGREINLKLIRSIEPNLTVLGVKLESMVREVKTSHILRKVHL